MKCLPDAGRRDGFTIIDLMIVVCTVLGFIIILLPMLARAMTCCRNNCASNLKQVGVAFRLYANDNDSHYPMTLSSNKGGTKEFTAPGDTYRHFLAASVELSAPMILVCPLENNKIPAPTFTTNFAHFNNSNISYFIGLDADEEHAGLLLAGDRNLKKRVMPPDAVMALSARTDVSWTEELHSLKSKEPCGNIGLADGSAQQSNNKRLHDTLAGNSNAVQRIMLP